MTLHADPIATPWSKSATGFIWFAAHHHPILFYNMVHHIIQGVWIGALGVFHTFLVIKNLTTNEYCNRKRLPYLQKNMQFFNPFDRGLIRNVLMFLGLAPKPADYTAVVAAAGLSTEVNDPL